MRIQAFGHCYQDWFLGAGRQTQENGGLSGTVYENEAVETDEVWACMEKMASSCMRLLRYALCCCGNGVEGHSLSMEACVRKGGVRRIAKAHIGA